MGMISAMAWGAKHGVSRQWAAEIVRNGRVAGAVFDGRRWNVPEDAALPSRLTPGRVPNPDSPLIQRERQRAEVRQIKAELRERKDTQMERWAEYVLQGEYDGRQHDIWLQMSDGCRFIDFGQKVDPHGNPVARIEDWDAEDEAFMLALDAAMKSGKIGKAD